MYYRYNVRTGVELVKSKAKKYVLSGLAITTMTVAGAAAPALAASGDYCGSSTNGCDAASAAGAQCGSGAGSGAFGALGKYHNEAGGTDGRQTGINNSYVCGNRPSSTF